MEIISVVGARPQFIKLAPVAAAFADSPHSHRVIHTGQHYDDRMSDIFFEGLDIPQPDWHLGIGSGSQGAQTGAMLAGVEGVLLEHRPDWLLVYGDTNSTLAATIAAVKLGIPVAHLEAGLRSFNRAMPEEHNRVLTDHAADLLMAPTEVAASHLRNEGLGDRCVIVGDVMVDIVQTVAAAVRTRPRPAAIEAIDGDYVLATVHRAENTDDPERLAAILAALEALPLPTVLPIHPRVAAALERLGMTVGSGSIVPIEPLAYDEMVSAVLGARSVVTDSGGLQKEAFVLGTPVTTLRAETEWVETLENGWNVLANDLGGLAELATRAAPATPPSQPYGDGNAAAAVVATFTAPGR